MWNAKLCRLNGRRLNVHFTLCTQKIHTLYSENADSELWIFRLWTAHTDPNLKMMWRSIWICESCNDEESSLRLPSKSVTTSTRTLPACDDALWQLRTCETTKKVILPDCYVRYFFPIIFDIGRKCNVDIWWVDRYVTPDWKCNI